MPSKRSGDRKNPWIARAKRNDKEHYIGYFATREAALQAELEYEKEHPPQQKRRKSTL